MSTSKIDMGPNSSADTSIRGQLKMPGLTSVGRKPSTLANEDSDRLEAALAITALADSVPEVQRPPPPPPTLQFRGGTGTALEKVVGLLRTRSVSRDSAPPASPQGQISGSISAFQGVQPPRQVVTSATPDHVQTATTVAAHLALNAPPPPSGLDLGRPRPPPNVIQPDPQGDGSAVKKRRVRKRKLDGEPVDATSKPPRKRKPTLRELLGQASLRTASSSAAVSSESTNSSVTSETNPGLTTKGDEGHQASDTQNANPPVIVQYLPQHLAQGLATGSLPVAVQQESLDIAATTGNNSNISSRKPLDTSPPPLVINPAAFQQATSEAVDGNVGMHPTVTSLPQTLVTSAVFSTTPHTPPVIPLPQTSVPYLSLNLPKLSFGPRLKVGPRLLSPAAESDSSPGSLVTPQPGQPVISLITTPVHPSHTDSLSSPRGVVTLGTSLPHSVSSLRGDAPVQSDAILSLRRAGIPHATGQLRPSGALLGHPMHKDTSVGPVHTVSTGTFRPVGHIATPPVAGPSNSSASSARSDNSTETGKSGSSNGSPSMSSHSLQDKSIPESSTTQKPPKAPLHITRYSNKSGSINLLPKSLNAVQSLYKQHMQPTDLSFKKDKPTAANKPPSPNSTPTDLSIGKKQNSPKATDCREAGPVISISSASNSAVADNNIAALPSTQRALVGGEYPRQAGVQQISTNAEGRQGSVAKSATAEYHGRQVPSDVHNTRTSSSSTVPHNLSASSLQKMTLNVLEDRGLRDSTTNSPTPPMSQISDSKLPPKKRRFFSQGTESLGADSPSSSGSPATTLQAGETQVQPAATAATTVPSSPAISQLTGPPSASNATASPQPATVLPPLQKPPSRGKGRSRGSGGRGRRSSSKSDLGVKTMHADVSDNRPKSADAGSLATANSSLQRPIPSVTTTAAVPGAVSSNAVLPSATKSVSASPVSVSASPASVSGNHTMGPMAVDPRMNLIMLQECQMAVKADEDGDLPLHIAVVQSELSVVDRLVAMMKMLAVKVDHYNNLRQTPLHLAVITKQVGMVTSLLSAEASPNLPDRKGHTAVHLAIQHGSLPCLKALLTEAKVKVDLDIKNYDGLAPLHLAVHLGHTAMVKLLLDRGAEVDTLDGKSGRTPLFYACENKKLELAELLIEHYANVNFPNYSGSTPVQVANSRGYASIVALLVKHGADTTSAATYEVQSRNVAVPVTSPKVKKALKDTLKEKKRPSGRVPRKTKRLRALHVDIPEDDDTDASAPPTPSTAGSTAPLNPLQVAERLTQLPQSAPLDLQAVKPVPPESTQEETPGSAKQSDTPEPSPVPVQPPTSAPATPQERPPPLLPIPQSPRQAMPSAADVIYAIEAAMRMLSPEHPHYKALELRLGEFKQAMGPGPPRVQQIIALPLSSPAGVIASPIAVHSPLMQSAAIQPPPPDHATTGQSQTSRDTPPKVAPLPPRSNEGQAETPRNHMLENKGAGPRPDKTLLPPNKSSPPTEKTGRLQASSTDAQVMMDYYTTAAAQMEKSPEKSSKSDGTPETRLTSEKVPAEDTRSTTVETVQQPSGTGQPAQEGTQPSLLGKRSLSHPGPLNGLHERLPMECPVPPKQKLTAKQQLQHKLQLKSKLLQLQRQRSQEAQLQQSAAVACGDEAQRDIAQRTRTASPEQKDDRQLPQMSSDMAATTQPMGHAQSCSPTVESQPKGSEEQKAPETDIADKPNLSANHKVKIGEEQTQGPNKDEEKTQAHEMESQSSSVCPDHPSKTLETSGSSEGDAKSSQTPKTKASDEAMDVDDEVSESQVTRSGEQLENKESSTEGSGSHGKG